MLRRFACSVALAAVLTAALAPLALAAPPDLKDPLLLRAVGLVERNYWKQPVDRELVPAGAVEGILGRLNRQERRAAAGAAATTSEALWAEERGFNQLLAPAEFKLMRDELSGGFSGIGAVLGPADAAGFEIQKVLAGGPAEAAGVLAGDRLASVDGTSVKGLELGAVVGLLRGPTGKVVRLSLLRGAEGVELQFPRGPVVIPTVEWRQLAEGEGYLRVASFNRRTPALVRTALKTMGAQGVRRLVVDLRQNPGGALDDAVAAASAFLPAGAPVVRTRQAGKPERLLRADGDRAWEAPVVCLVDEATASGAEILAGALREAKLALLAGRPTFGKDSVQTVYELPRGFALKLSTMALDVLGRSKGARLEPDVLLPAPPEGRRATPPDPDKAAADPWVESALAIARFRS